MGETILTSTVLSPDECRQRIADAASPRESEVVGWDLFGQIEVIDGGDQFELRHRVEPAVLAGTIQPSGKGSVVRGELEVPAQSFYRFGFGFATIIALIVLGASACDLIFGTHLLYTRSWTELGPGHPANTEQHVATFLLIPLVCIPILLILWPKARGMSNETRQAFVDFLNKLFSATDARLS